jgi:ribose transport system substrate-binding protein
MRKLWSMYLLLIVCFGGYVYVQSFHASSVDSFHQAGGGLKGSNDEKYVMITFQSGIDYWKNVLKGFEDAAEVLNVSVEYRGATEYDVQEQINVLEQVIARNPSGIAVSVIHAEALTHTLNKAVEAGIPLVLFDSGAPMSKAQSTLATDNFQAGVTAAHKMAELSSRRGKVAVITSPNQLNLQERTNGFTETIRNHYAELTVIAVEDGKGDPYFTEQVTRSLLKQYPDLSGIFITEANGGVGAGNAIQAANKEGIVKIIGFDTNKGTLDMVRSGVISATLAQGTWNMGYWSLLHLFHLRHSDSKHISPIPPRVDTGITVVTQNNIDTFYAK